MVPDVVLHKGGDEEVGVVVAALEAQCEGQPCSGTGTLEVLRQQLPLHEELVGIPLA